MTEVRLGLAQAVDLAHALVASVAERISIEVLFIKGPVANHHRLRRTTVSSDVDVLVAPKDAPALIDALHDVGWRHRPESRAHATFVTHSRTLIHQGWPCDIDVHVEYPGFGRPPSAVFDALQSRAVEVEIAGRRLPGSSEIDSVLISALHSLRAPYLQRSKAEYAELVERVRSNEKNRTFVLAIAQRSSELGAGGFIDPFLRSIDAPEMYLGSQAPEPLWILRSADLSRTAEWLNHLFKAPARTRPAILWHALVPTRADLLIDHPFAGGRALFTLRVRRISKGLVALPRALMALRRARRLKPVQALHVPGALIIPGETNSLLSVDAPLLVSNDGFIARSAATSESVDSYEPDVPCEVAVEPDALSSDAVIVRSRQVAFSEQPEGVAVLSLKSSTPQPVVLSGTALFFWKALSKPCSVGDLVDAAAEAYEVGRSDIFDDVTGFLLALEADGIIEVTS